MIHSIFSAPLRKGIQIILVLLLGLTTLGTSSAYAFGMCVHPTGAGGCFTSIQAAVDAANDGASILIWKGTYVEQVTIIGKNLTLLGKPGAVVRAPASMEDTLSSVAGTEGRPIILVNNADITIRGLVVDGANSAEANPFMQGIAFINADGTIRGNTVKDVGFGTPTLPVIDDFPIYMGEGIVVVNFDPSPRTVTVMENWVSGYNSSGITVFAEADPNDPTLSNLTVHVIKNTVVGAGPTDAIDQWGIFFGGYNFADAQYSITGSIKGNRIKNQVTVAPYPYPGIGILSLSTANVEISGNEVENVNAGFIANQAYGAQVTYNKISGPSGNPTGSTGLLYSGRDSYVSGNYFKSLEIGALLFIEDFDFGTAYSTVFDDNRFDKVSMDILTGQGAPVEILSLSATSASDTPNANILNRLPIK